MVTTADREPSYFACSIYQKCLGWEVGLVLILCGMTWSCQLLTGSPQGSQHSLGGAGEGHREKGTGEPPQPGKKLPEPLPT